MFRALVKACTALALMMQSAAPLWAAPMHAQQHQPAPAAEQAMPCHHDAAAASDSSPRARPCCCDDDQACACAAACNGSAALTPWSPGLSELALQHFAAVRAIPAAASAHALRHLRPPISQPG
ncbi:MAG TPA: hypothetical protein VM074_10900 [Solimonas sp.]|nr:hypothetical protein [Solimonas sp.]